MSKKLDNPSTSSKSHWPFVNDFLNNIKTTNILTLQVNGRLKLVSDGVIYIFH